MVAVNANLILSGHETANEVTIGLDYGRALLRPSNNQAVTNTGAITATGSGHIDGSGATFNADAGSSLTGTLPLLLEAGTLNRSEERRVGKDCRARGSPNH